MGVVPYISEELVVNLYEEIIYSENGSLNNGRKVIEFDNAEYIKQYPKITITIQNLVNQIDIIYANNSTINTFYINQTLYKNNILVIDCLTKVATLDGSPISITEFPYIEQDSKFSISIPDFVGDISLEYTSVSPTPIKVLYKDSFNFNIKGNTVEFDYSLPIVDELYFNPLSKYKVELLLSSENQVTASIRKVFCNCTLTTSIQSGDVGFIKVKVNGKGTYLGQTLPLSDYFDSKNVSVSLTSSSGFEYVLPEVSSLTFTFQPKYMNKRIFGSRHKQLLDSIEIQASIELPLKDRTIYNLLEDSLILKISYVSSKDILPITIHDSRIDNYQFSGDGEKITTSLSITGIYIGLKGNV